MSGTEEKDKIFAEPFLCGASGCSKVI